MRTHIIEFGVYTNFSKCDSVSWELSYDVTEEEYQRLVEAANEYHDFRNAVSVSDIYEKVYEAAVKQATKDMIENDPEWVVENLEEGELLENWSIDSISTTGVNFPNELLRECEDN